MTRIGFAYNQKPEIAAGDERAATDVAPTADEEPPSTSGAADRYAEWDTPETIEAVARALSALGTVVRLEATADFPQRLQAERPDIVFNIAEGLAGVNRESHVPAICEFYGIPYSGSDPLTLSTCLHKGRAKEVLAYNGVPTAPFAVVESLRDLERLLDGHQQEMLPLAVPARRIPDAFPLFVKPGHEGSSKGVTARNLVHSRAELVTRVTELLDCYDQPVLVEDYLPGAEFTCAVLGNGDEARVLPIVAINFSELPAGAAPIYGFEAKWVWDTPDRPLHIFDCPARIPESLRRFVAHQKTLSVAELWQGPPEEHRSPYGSYWYRAVACILLSGRVQAKRDGGPNRTDINRVGKDLRFTEGHQGYTCCRTPHRQLAARE
jgi:D-alanine-D-alanine ligase